MSREVMAAAIRGAHAFVEEAEKMFAEALRAKGEDELLAFPETAFQLPMIHALMGSLGVGDPATVMKVDDTATGIEEGLNAGAVTIGVLTGTQTRERLLQARPHAIIESVRLIPDYLEAMGFV